MVSITPEKWVVLQIDRYHDKLGYGLGPELRYLYNGTVFRDIILSKNNTTYDKDSGDLIVNNSGIKIIIKGEPDHKWFDDTIYSKWEKWDDLVGKYDEDRLDYKPWSYNTMEIIADELGIVCLKDNDNKTKFYIKK